MTTTALEPNSFWQKRFTVLTLTFIAFVICYLDRVNISIAAIQMQEELGWSDVTKGYVFSFFFWGYFTMQVVSGYLANRFGGKLVLGAAVIFWSIFTIATPGAAYWSIPALLAVRLLMGMGEAGLAPSSFSIVGRWFPHQERSRVMGLLSSGSTVGTVLALIIGSWLVSEYGWPSVFYAFGGLGLIWAIFWFWFVKNQPSEHPNISNRELDHILSGTTVQDRPETIPWRKILSVSPVWAVCAAYFSISWSLYIFLSWLPSYFNDVHGLDLSGAGFFSLFPWIAMAIMLNVTGWIADGMIQKGVSTTATRKILVAVGMIGSACMILLLRGAETPLQASLYVSAALGILAFAYAGIVPNVLDLAPRFADILHGFVNTFGTLAGALGAPVAGYILQATASYDLVFVVTAVVLVVGCGAYSLLGTGEQIID